MSTAPADYDAQIRRGDLDVVLIIDEQFAADVAQGKAGSVRLVFDRSRDRARASIEQAESLLRGYNRLWGEQRLMLRGVASTRRQSAARSKTSISPRRSNPARSCCSSSRTTVCSRR